MADKKTTLMSQFYEQCQAKGYTDMKDATQSLKAKVIATDLKLNYGNIVEFYAKAKNCYEQIQAEKVEEERRAEFARKMQEEENARRAINGELLVTIDVRERENSDDIKVRVYLRPDYSVYTVVGRGGKIEGAPAVNVKRGAVLTMTYHPSKAIYTGATVGGITTGGVHYTEAGYSQKASNTDTGSVHIIINGEEFLVREFAVSDLVKSRFKRDSVFCDYLRSGATLCYKSSLGPNLLREAAFKADIKYGDRMNMLSRAADKDRLPYTICEKLAELLGRIANAKFPPSDEQLYAAAEELAAKETSDALKRAAEAFLNISDYRDAAQRAKEAEVRYEEILQEEKEQAILKKEAVAKKRKTRMAIAVSLVAVVAIAAVIMVKIVIPNGKYDDAVALMESKQYDEAIAAFEVLDGYKDSNAKITDCYYGSVIALMDANRYEDAIAAFETLDGRQDSADKIADCKVRIYDKASSLVETGDDIAAMLLFGFLGDYKDSRAQSFGLWDQYAVRETISTGRYSTVALKANDTVVSIGNSIGNTSFCEEVSDIVAVSAGGVDDTVGLKADGTVVVLSGTGCDVSAWSDIVAVSVGWDHVVGLKADGTVVAVGDSSFGQCDVSAWRGIVAISAGVFQTVGLKADGTVVAVGQFHENPIWDDISDWNDIVAISANDGLTVGLKADGTVVNDGGSYYGVDVSGWSDIVAVSAGESHAVGLKADGTVVAVGDDRHNECKVSEWTDIVAISAGSYFTIGLKADGTVVAAGSDDDACCDVGDWSDIRLPNN